MNESPDDDHGRCDLLACLGCLTVDCGGIGVRITVGETAVIWDNFAHTYDDQISFPWVGPFMFDRAEYEWALESVARAAGAFETTVVISRYGAGG